jgi:hypothetical protein
MTQDDGDISSRHDIVDGITKLGRDASCALAGNLSLLALNLDYPELFREHTTIPLAPFLIAL